MAISFIEKRKPAWQQLERLLNCIHNLRSLRNLSRIQVRHLGNSYRRTVADLAIARVESRDQRLISYLNNLMIRSHSLIYHSKINGVQFVWNFYRTEFPAIFRQTYRYSLAVLLLFLGIALFSFINTWRNDDFAEFAYLTSQTIHDIKESHSWWESLNESAPVGAVAIIFNNIGVALRVFALSLFPVAGTLYAIIPSSMQFGAINALAIKYQMKLEIWSFVAGHGVLELTAIFIAGGAGLLLGTSLLMPCEYTRRDALLVRGFIAVKLLLGCIPLLILAGLIESFISPTSMHFYFKIVISVGSVVILLFYLLAVGKIATVKTTQPKH